jgi:hypothetical protein
MATFLLSLVREILAADCAMVMPLLVMLLVNLLTDLPPRRSLEEESGETRTTSTKM